MRAPHHHHRHALPCSDFVRNSKTAAGTLRGDQSSGPAQVRALGRDHPARHQAAQPDDRRGGFRRRQAHRVCLPALRRAPKPNPCATRSRHLPRPRAGPRAAAVTRAPPPCTPPVSRSGASRRCRRSLSRARLSRSPTAPPRSCSAASARSTPRLSTCGLSAAPLRSWRRAVRSSRAIQSTLLSQPVAAAAAAAAAVAAGGLLLLDAAAGRQRGKFPRTKHTAVPQDRTALPDLSTSWNAQRFCLAGHPPYARLHLEPPKGERPPSCSNQLRIFDTRSQPPFTLCCCSVP